jgi:dihydrofolate reductase
VDEIRLSIMPVLLGDGLRLFDNSITEKRCRLESVVAYKTGIVELSYQLQSTTHSPESGDYELQRLG